MNVVVTTEAQFVRNPDGAVYSLTGGRAYDFWARYLEVFSGVTVLARVTDGFVRSGLAVAGDGVEVAPVRSFRGLRSFIAKLPELRRQAHSLSCRTDTAYILRIPGLVGSVLAERLRAVGRPYAVEVVGYPDTAFAASAGSVSAIASGLSKWHMRRQCLNAAAASYVTGDALQRSYPTRPSVASFAISSIDLPDEAFCEVSRRFEGFRPEEAVLVAVGSLLRFKGHDVLLGAFAALHSDGAAGRLVIVGDGPERAALQAASRRLDIAHLVEFRGVVPAGHEIREVLDSCDIFVLPSLREGLPRAVIEAMARALPAVATRTGGLNELLPDDCLAAPGDVAELAKCLKITTTDPARLRSMSSQNLAHARLYANSALAQRRRQFYENVLSVTTSSRRIRQ